MHLCATSDGARMQSGCPTAHRLDPEADGTQCPQCQHENAADAKFCNQCATAPLGMLAEEVETGPQRRRDGYETPRPYCHRDGWGVWHR